jgi:beta-glucosidase
MLKIHKQRLKQLLTQMTLDEKLAQLVSFWMHELQDSKGFSRERATSLLRNGIGQITRPASDSDLEPVAVASFNNAVQNFLVKETRLAVPAIIHDECCCGYMGLGGTTYPQILGLASTFEPQLARQMTVEIRKQMRSVGIHQGLAPVLDVARDPRWGRVEETFGEDPLLVSHFGMAYISGLQGENLAAGGVMATGKHFVGYSFSQGGQNCAPVRLGVQDLWNIYLVPFQAAIRAANLHTIMNAYPELDGEVVAASRRILTDLLRNTLGFEGIVVSDYEAIDMIHTYQRVAENKRSAAVLALTAGIDMELPTRDCYSDPLREAIEANEVNLEFVDTAVERILHKKMELGLFENPYVDEGRVPEFFETTDQRTLAREIARKSMVLLKNNGVLPLVKDTRTLAVIGPNADSKSNLLGDYSYAAVLDLKSGWMPGHGSNFEKIDIAHLEQHSIQIPTILSALKTALPATNILYAKGCDNLENDTAGFDEAVNLARQAEAVVLVLGDRSGMTPHCTVGETRDSADLRLPGVQDLLAEAIFATGKSVIVVLVTGRPYAINRLVEKADAILEAWLPGEEGAAAIVETILGLNNPGGKLAMTFPRHVGQTPIFYNQKPSGGKSNWYTHYINIESSPLFPFGHGLSYTTFKYSQFSISRLQARVGETLDINVKITNTGKLAGDEVAQLYIQDEYGSVPRPIKELKGYARLTLHPGETKTITFHLPINQLAFYDIQLNYIVESGTFKVMIGSSSDDIRCEGEFIVVGDKKSLIKEQVYICPVQIQ